MLNKIHAYFQRRSAAKAAHALYQFMVLHNMELTTEQTRKLSQVRNDLLSWS